jgi:membrane protein
MEILYELIDIQVVSAVKTKFEKETAYQPAVDINRITIKYLSDKLDHHGYGCACCQTGKEIEKIKENNGII